MNKKCLVSDARTLENGLNCYELIKKNIIIKEIRREYYTIKRAFNRNKVQVECRNKSDKRGNWKPSQNHSENTRTYRKSTKQSTDNSHIGH